ncbi:short-subunit dehydrogenase [Pseudomonas frederiksbergensis]|jgi:short-subunit dehydrogenase
MNSYEGFAMPTIFHRENIKASGVINFASLAGVVGMPGYVLFLASKDGQFLTGYSL